MNKFILFLIILLPLFVQTSFAQIDGDNIFEENQIISIDLDFSQINFWDSLLANYATSTYMKADLTLTDVTGTYTFADVGVRLKGNSSYSHPNNKKSFKIDFNRFVSGQNYDGLKKLNLSNGFKDPTCMREKLFYDFCQSADVPAPRANFANVNFNGTLWGFYTVVEQIDDQFLDWRILDDDGNLFKAGSNFGGGPGGGGDEADLIYYGTDQTEYEDRYELKSNEDENDWSDLIAFTDFINNSSPTVYENEIEEHLELQEYLRSAAIDNLFSNLDSYTQSARNYYIYHNLTTDKWQWIKWDGNESFGTYGAGGPGGGLDLINLALDYHANNRPLLENTFNSPLLYQQYLEEVCILTENYFNSDYMDAKIDELKNLIQSSVYADNNKMYTNANFDDNIENDISLGGGPMGGTVFGLKSFIEEKSNFVEGEIDCSIIISVEDEPTDYTMSVYPNPASSTINIEWGDLDAVSVTVHSCLGEKILEADVVGQERANLDLNKFQNGTYILTLLLDDAANTITEKVIILK